MKRVFGFLLVLIISLIVAACGKAPIERSLVQDESAIDRYSDFITGLSSGKVIKYDYSFENWYDIVSSTRTVVKFSHGEGDLPAILVSQKHPAVFWDIPSPKYFDGNTLYYKYKGTWYTDRGGFKSGLKDDYFGFPPSIIEGNNIKADNVYTRPDGGYDLYIQTEDEQTGVHYLITCQADENYSIKNILIRTYSPKNIWKTDYHTKSCYMVYSNINKDYTVEPPAELKTGGKDNAEITAHNSAA